MLCIYQEFYDQKMAMLCCLADLAAVAKLLELHVHYESGRIVKVNQKNTLGMLSQSPQVWPTNKEEETLPAG